MKLKHLGGWFVVLALSACPPPKLDGCGGNTCADTERCDQDTLTCMADEPPKISAIAPNVVVSTPTFALSGIITDDVAVTEAEWKTDSSGPLPLTLDEEGGFTITVDAPMLDSKPTVITLRAKDRLTQTTKDVSVQVDRVPPELSLMSPDAGSLVGAASVQVVVKATDGADAISEMAIDGQAVSMPRSGVEAAQMIAVPATLNADALDFVVTARDPYGNQATQTFSLVGDRVGPDVNIGMPSASAVIATSGFTVDVAVTDPSPIATVNVQFQGMTYAATESSAGHWTAMLNTTVEEMDEVISVEATDAAGNLTTVTRTVRVDRVAPTVNVASPMAGVLVAGSIPVSVTTSTGADFVEVTIEGNTTQLTGGPTLWTGGISTPSRDYSDVILTATARDAAGNSASTDVMFKVDAVPPVLTFTSPTMDQRFNASAFTTSQNVVVTWTVVDADPQAGTAQINGVASTALTTSVATTANDNPATYSTTVVARDRMGNTAQGTVTWSVDRRAPTVVTWTPANNARNVEPWQSVITFSERVSGALSTSPALTITGQTAPTNDSWNTAHTTYTLPLDTFKSRVLDVGIAANLADDYGNPVASSTRKFHLATGFTGTSVVATGVSQYDVSSDSDGVMTIAVITTTGALAVYEDTGGAFAQLALTQPQGSVSQLSINSANVVSGTTLQSSRRVGVTANVPTHGSPWWRYQFVDGVVTGNPTMSVPGAAVVSRPQLPNEPSPTATFATIDGSNYVRGSVTRTLSNTGKMVVAQSNDSIAAFDTSATQVLWSHYRCRNGFSGYSCGSIGYGASATNPTRLQTAMTPSGSCLATTWTSGTTRQGVFQALSPCDFTACFDDTALSLTGSIPADLRVAAYGANGENTLLFTSVAPNGLDLNVSKMTDACGVGSAFIGSIPRPAAHQPVRVGNHPGVVFLVGNTLQLRVF